jgi:hypothetical protein
MAFVFGKLLQFGTNSAPQVLAVRNGVETMESSRVSFRIVVPAEIVKLGERNVVHQFPWATLSQLFR